MAAHDSDGGTLEQRNLRLVRFADDYLRWTPIMRQPERSFKV